MKRILIIALLCAFTIVSSRASAQDATPDASQTPTTGGDSAIGNAVVYVNEQGKEAARITVDEIIDSFDEYDEGYEPERGTRYVAVRVTFEATGEEPISVTAYNVSLLDSQGFWLGTASISRTAEQEAADPLLEDAELTPGDSVSGLLI